MTREVDKRNLEFVVAGAPSAGLEGVTSAFRLDRGVESDGPARIDAFTGSMLRVEASGVPWEGSPRLAAMLAARGASEGMERFTDGPAADFALPQDVRTTGSGTSVVHVAQQHHGLPVFQARRTVQLRPEGRLIVTGSSVEMLGDVETEAEIDVLEAVRRAAEHLAGQDEEESRYETGFPDRVVSPRLDLEGFDPVMVAQFDLPMRPTLIAGAPFAGYIKAHLLYFYQGPEMRLGWHIELVFPGHVAAYEVIVAAGQGAGEVLYARNRVCNLLGRCEVHTHNPQETPRSAQALPPDPAGLPTTLRPWPAGSHWLSAAETTGNNVAGTDEAAAALSGAHQDGTIHFTPSGGIQEAVLNTFYFCNLMHDFFYALGFDEASGNFQTINPNNDPGANDPVRAWVFDKEVEGVATMLTPPDGTAPTMRMGKYGDRHTGFDSDVVFHEYVHGVTNRLVGGRLDAGALTEPQSRGMGEGWSDYFALTFQNVSRTSDKNVTGDWVTARPGRGIRGHPYTDAFPDGFGSLASGRYAGSVHARGEIWCATLMKATRDLATALNDKKRGYAIAWQAVVDGLKLAPANPSFLDARDAVLAAIDDLGQASTISPQETTNARSCFWRAFAHFGMGVNAASRGATLLGIVADHQVPAGV